MSNTIDTQLGNVNIWEGTLDQIIGASIGENDLAFASDVDYEDKFRYLIMPVATEELSGKIVQYIGGTNDDYTQGSFYKCIKTDEVVTPAIISATTESPNISNIVVTDGDNFLSQLTAKSVECNVGDTFTFGYNSSWSLWCYPSGSGNSYRLYECMTYDGSAAEGDEITFTYVSGPVYKCEWVEVKKEVVANWNNIEGDITENTELQEALESKQEIIQVTTLPAITEDNKDKIYQYIGESDFANGLYQGSFYKASGIRYEVDNEQSQEIDNIAFVVENETAWLRSLNGLFTDHPTANYVKIVFGGEGTGSDGYYVPGWIDKTLMSTAYYTYTQRLWRQQNGIVFVGTPVINDANDTDPDTSPNTIIHVNITNDLSDYTTWKWRPISIYPGNTADNSQVLVNKSRYTTSVVEHFSGDNFNSDADYKTIMGVGASGGFGSTAFGYKAWAGRYGVVIGSQHPVQKFGYGNGIVAIGYQMNGNNNGEWGTMIGADTTGGDRSVAVGASAKGTGRYSISIGCLSQSPNESAIAIGKESKSLSEFAIAIGSGTTSNALRAIAIGNAASAFAQDAIQIGNGANNTPNTLKVWDIQLLDRTSGTIPVERFSSDSPTDGYVLTYDAENNNLIWTNPIPEIPEIQVTEMPTPTYAGQVVQYVGEDDGELVHGYFYNSVYNKDEDYFYWTQMNVQPNNNNIDYNNLSNKPQIEGTTLEGNLSLSDLGIKRVALTGSYADLTTKPGINGYPIEANSSAEDLGFATVATTGDYNDLINKPSTQSLPELPADKDTKSYMLMWDHTDQRMKWVPSIINNEDLGVIPEPTTEG